MASSTTVFMKPLSWDKQLGFASPLKCAAIQSGQTNNPSMDKDEVGDEVGLDASHHTRIFQRGGGESFSLTSSFIGLVKSRYFNSYPEPRYTFLSVKRLICGGSRDGTPAGPIRDKRVTPSRLCALRTVHQPVSVGHLHSLAGKPSCFPPGVQSASLWQPCCASLPQSTPSYESLSLVGCRSL